MGVIVQIEDVDADTLARLEGLARAHGVSLSDYLRDRLEDMARGPRRRAGALRDVLGDVGDPLDGWGPISEEDLALWEGRGDDSVS